ncbi:AHH domain-containing protein [Thalassolituus oleivorans]|uniref:AHH domain-containing protein n=1 Tax=Thalassolituus oleivorans TaxID=187493 RepID=UPI0023EFBCFF|nr:AHH domain-containing protein [Thalassolituus oleivorans]
MKASTTEVEVVEVQPHELLNGLIEVIRETDRTIGYYEMKKMVGEHVSTSAQQQLEKRNQHLSMQEVTRLAAKLYNKIMVRGTIQALTALAGYQAEAKGMTKKQFQDEDHNPSRLSRHIRGTGVSRPPNVAAHAIISGTHADAAAARDILARFKIRIDDPDNGVYLPRDNRFIPHPKMPDAAGHSKVHTKKYYTNITNMLQTATSEFECRLALRLIAKELREGSWEY